MSFLTEWLTSIILFILFAIVIDMLLPSSSMQKYAKMVVSLLLIIVMLNPIFKLFKTDPEIIFDYLTKQEQSQSADIKNQIKSEKKEIQASNRAYVLERMPAYFRSLNISAWLHIVNAAILRLLCINSPRTHTLQPEKKRERGK